MTNPVFHEDLFDIADAQVRTRESFQDLARTVVGLPMWGYPQEGTIKIKASPKPRFTISSDDGRPALKYQCEHEWRAAYPFVFRMTCQKCGATK